MAELVVRLRVDPETGKKHVVIQYTSDLDALPEEHEEDHRRLVDQLIAGGALRKEQLGEIVVEGRPEEHAVGASEPDDEAERAAQGVEEG